MPRLNARWWRRGAGRGFSLVEVLVVITILGIVGSAVFRVVIKQQQAYRDSSRQSDMQRELRLVGSFIPSEIRSASSAGLDIKKMNEDEVEFLATFGSGMICSRPNPVVFVIPPLLTAGITLTNWYTQPVVGDSVFLYDDALLKGAEDDRWERRQIAAISSTVFDCPGAPFTDPVLDAGKLRWRITVVGGPLPAAVTNGAVVRFARPVRYRLFQGTSRKWFMGYQDYSNGSWAAIDAVGGPFRPFVSGDNNPSGLQFRYFDSLGVRLDNTSDKSRLSRIDVFLRTNAGLAAVTERRPNDVRDSVMMRIGLRNFK